MCTIAKWLNDTSLLSVAASESKRTGPARAAAAPTAAYNGIARRL